jgi:hypothetical protein
MGPISIDKGTAKRAARRCKLSELIVRKTKPEPLAFLIWDIMQRGLVLRVHPTGRRSWHAIYWSNRRPRWLHLGDADAIALARIPLPISRSAISMSMPRSTTRVGGRLISLCGGSRFPAGASCKPQLSPAPT